MRREKERYIELRKKTMTKLLAAPKRKFRREKI